MGTACRGALEVGLSLWNSQFSEITEGVDRLLLERTTPESWQEIAIAL